MGANLKVTNDENGNMAFVYLQDGFKQVSSTGTKMALPLASATADFQRREYSGDHDHGHGQGKGQKERISAYGTAPTLSGVAGHTASVRVIITAMVLLLLRDMKAGQ